MCGKLRTDYANRILRADDIRLGFDEHFDVEFWRMKGKGKLRAEKT